MFGELRTPFPLFRPSADQMSVAVDVAKTRLRFRMPNWLGTFVSWFIGAVVFFRQPFSSGFDDLFGNVGDPRMIAMLHEHWFQTLRAKFLGQVPGFSIR